VAPARRAPARRGRAHARHPCRRRDARLARAKAALLDVRSRRVRPGLDDKVLTSWNALAIAGLSRASRAMGEGAFDELARDAVDALRRTVWRDGRLYATRRGDEPALPAYLDDYAFLLDALSSACRTRSARTTTTGRSSSPTRSSSASRIATRAASGSPRTTTRRCSIARCPGHDNATPSGNGVAARALASLGALAGETRYLDAARRAGRALSPRRSRTRPGGFSTLLEAAARLEHPPTQVIVSGASADATAWRDALVASWRPGLEVYVVDPRSAPRALVKGAAPASGARAWVCRGMTCLPPVDSLGALRPLVGPGRGGLIEFDPFHRFGVRLHEALDAGLAAALAGAGAAQARTPPRC
jgi:uncharacterized protein YyaL (SSP411 family)